MLAVVFGFLDQMQFVQQSEFGKPLATTFTILTKIIQTFSVSSDGSMNEVIKAISSISAAEILAEFGARKFGFIKLDKNNP
ncbi:MAG: hypothetical protein H7328_07945 [Bdellovibrio sp.]|nr:hypothetical protein [Bdellovibrio sp.]